MVVFDNHSRYHVSVCVGRYLPTSCSQLAGQGQLLSALVGHRESRQLLYYICPTFPPVFQDSKVPPFNLSCVIPCPAETVLPNIKQEISTIINDGMVARQLATHLSLINHTNKQEVKWKQGRFQACNKIKHVVTMRMVRQHIVLLWL